MNTPIENEQPEVALALIGWLGARARFLGAQRSFALIPRERRLTWKGEV